MKNVGTTDADDDTSDTKLNIACINEYAACCSHLARNGECTGDILADYSALTEEQGKCATVSRGGGGGDDDSSSDDNATGNAVTAGVGSTLALAAGAVAMW